MQMRFNVCGLFLILGQGSWMQLKLDKVLTDVWIADTSPCFDKHLPVVNLLCNTGELLVGHEKHMDHISSSS